MRFRIVAIGILLSLIGTTWPSLASADQTVYPTAGACWEATHLPCSRSDQGWIPAQMGDPANGSQGTHQYDEENLAHQATAMLINTSGTPDHPVVAVDMNQVNFPDAQPYLDPEIGRVRVPIRFVSQQMGAVVDWNGETQTVTITRDALMVQLRVNDSHVVVNGTVVEIDAPPRLVDPGRVMVPLRFISEAFGAAVDWVGSQSPDPSDQAWGGYQVWIWVPWGYWGKYSINDRLNVYKWWFYRGGQP